MGHVVRTTKCNLEVYPLKIPLEQEELKNIQRFSQFIEMSTQKVSTLRRIRIKFQKVIYSSLLHECTKLEGFPTMRGQIEE